MTGMDCNDVTIKNGTNRGYAPPRPDTASFTLVYDTSLWCRKFLYHFMLFKRLTLLQHREIFLCDLRNFDFRPNTIFHAMHHLYMH